ncbi:MAG TPA: cobalamin biosynthesis protein, partial [Desulfomicrobiaceae bacterium]|nr:cobalamin biosynthesis protein [Desulfomicrobiaceae bacterium]
PEAALAGALGVRLGGPSVYFGQNVDKPWIGGEGTDPGALEYLRTVRLLYLVSFAAAGLTVGALAVSGYGLVGPLFGAGW